MDEQNICTCRISKAGKNLFARVPDEDRHKITRGALVKITLLEPVITDLSKLKSELKGYLKQPSGVERLKGTIMGYPINISIAKLIHDLPKNKLEKIFYEALADGNV